MNAYIATLLAQFLPQKGEHKVTLTWSRAGDHAEGLLHLYVLAADSATGKRIAEITVRIYE